MKLSFKFNPKLAKLQTNIINALSFHTTKLYNIANYDCLNSGAMKYAKNKSRRISRGLFKSNTGLLINTDVNGSLNILRLYIKDTSIPELITSAMDNRVVNSPVKLRVA